MVISISWNMTVQVFVFILALNVNMWLLVAENFMGLTAKKENSIQAESSLQQKTFFIIFFADFVRP